MPHASVFLAGAPRPAPRGVSLVPPTIAVEVVSASPADERRDRVEKLADYAAFGVKWYWLVDPELRTFEILERDPQGRFCHVAAATSGAIGLVPGCPGLTIDVDALWRDVDALIAEGAPE